MTLDDGKEDGEYYYVPHIHTHIHIYTYTHIHTHTHTHTHIELHTGATASLFAFLLGHLRMLFLFMSLLSSRQFFGGIAEHVGHNNDL